MDGRSLYDRTQDRTYIATEGWNAAFAGTWAGIRGRIGTNSYHYIESYIPNGVTVRADTIPNDDGSTTTREFYDLGRSEAETWAARLLPPPARTPPGRSPGR